MRHEKLKIKEIFNKYKTRTLMGEYNGYIFVVTMTIVAILMTWTCGGK